jgi:Integral membrane protein (intg_mem_TP0381)
LTPDLHVRFPSLEFLQFVVGHLGIVLAASYLVVGLGMVPRQGAAVRVFAITVAYAIVIGAFNWFTGSNYMYLAAPAQNPSPVDARSVAVVTARRDGSRHRPFRCSGRTVPTDPAMGAARRAGEFALAQRDGHFESTSVS